eukprot:scaffold4347_cov55-Attheya_sp.AAC.1
MHSDTSAEVDGSSSSTGVALLADWWNRWLHRHRLYVLGGVLGLVWPFGLYALHTFPSRTDSTFVPVPTSPSGRAVRLFRRAYSNTSKGGDLSLSDPLNPGLFVVLDYFEQNGSNSTTLIDGKSSIYNATRDYCFALEHHLQQALPKLAHRLIQDAHWNGTVQVEVISYYSLKEDKLPHLAKSLAMPDGRTALVPIRYSIPSALAHQSSLKRRYIDSILDLVRQFESPSDIQVSYTGMKYFQRDLIITMHEDLKRMDVWVLPLALILLAIVLRAHMGVLLLPLMAIITTVFSWSIAMLGLCRMMQMTQFTPSVMMSLTIGMGIDYTLFLLSRFLADAPSMGVYDAVSTMLSTAGHTILVSGLTLQCTFLGLTLLPLQMLRSIGVGAAVAIGMALLVNLTFVPALLHTRYGTWLLDKHAFGNQPLLSYGGVLVKWFDSSTSRHDENDDTNAPSTPVQTRTSLPRDAAPESQISSIVGTPMRDSAGESNDSYTSFRDVIGASSQNGRLSFMPAWMTPRQKSSTHVDDIGTSHHDTSSPVLESLLDEVHDVSDEIPPVDSMVSTRSLWYRLSLLLLHPYYSVAILMAILALLLPVAIHASAMKSSISFESILPSTSPSLTTLHHLEERFGLGTLSPYRIVFDRHATNKRIDDADSFGLMHTVIQALIQADQAMDDNKNSTKNNHTDSSHEFEEGVNLDNIPFQLDNGDVDLFESMELVTTKLFNFEQADKRRRQMQLQKDAGFETFFDDSSASPRATSYNGISFIRNVPVPHMLFVSAKLCSEKQPFCPVEFLHILDYVDHKSTSPDRRTTYVTATLGVNPFSDKGIAWLLAARRILDQLALSGDLNGFEVVIEGGASVEYDAVQEVYAAFPTMIALTLCVVFVLMGIFFRSIVTPLRSVLSISLTVAYVFGLSVLVFQKGILNWTGVHSWETADDAELSWLAPIMSFSIIVGLGLDYDVFLISRVLEFRLAGYGHKSSILFGLNATGGIITAAGIIMAVAFGGLMLTSSPALCQWAFILTSAVLLDTFVIRTLVVPILMGYTGEYSWWPRQLPNDHERFAYEALSPQPTEALLQPDLL